MVYLLIAWWFSMAMLNNHMVSVYTHHWIVVVKLSAGIPIVLEDHEATSLQVTAWLWEWVIFGWESSLLNPLIYISWRDGKTKYSSKFWISNPSVGSRVPYWKYFMLGAWNYANQSHWSGLNSRVHYGTCNLFGMMEIEIYRTTRSFTNLGWEATRWGLALL